MEMQILPNNNRRLTPLSKLNITFDEPQAKLTIKGQSIAFGIYRLSEVIVLNRFGIESDNELVYDVQSGPYDERPSLYLLPIDSIVALVASNDYLNQWESLKDLFGFAMTHAQTKFTDLAKLEEKDRAYFLEIPLRNFISRFQEKQEPKKSIASKISKRFKKHLGDQSMTERSPSKNNGQSSERQQQNHQTGDNVVEYKSWAHLHYKG